MVPMGYRLFYMTRIGLLLMPFSNHFWFLKEKQNAVVEDTLSLSCLVM